ncbi:MAG TPA: phospholipid carrier-dependent glycosyltransferase [Gemmatimonadaceae bacterium]|nr:phospholipid carrier-dependent glycosyltransferase [Gemmatimonadaceae bacterium]
MPARPAQRLRPELLVLFVLAVVTRFWSLTSPHDVVFDEALYEEYIGHYFNGTYYFNLHPPVGKLILALGAHLLGIAPHTLQAIEPAVTLRAIPAAAGALIIPVFYQLLTQLGANRRTATLGAFLLLCDTAVLAVSRFILIDSILILFMLCALSAWLASRTRTGGARSAFVIASAVFSGLAAGTKWTGLGALGVIGIDWLRSVIMWRGGPAAARDGGLAPVPVRALAVEGGILAVVPALVYAGAFAVHFALLPNSGNGDRVMSAAFTETLVGSPTYRPDAHLSFAAKLLDLHRAMIHENVAFETAMHEGASPWWSWPILKHPLYVWAGGGPDASTVGHVLIEGNLVVWWGALVGMLVLAAAAASGRARERLAPYRRALAFLAVAYVVNFLPFAFITRILFLYSYLPALVVSVAIATIGIGALADWTGGDGRSRFASRRSAALYWGVAALACVTFLYFAPFAYGSPMTNAAYHRRLWVLERHFGQP